MHHYQAHQVVIFMPLFRSLWAFKTILKVGPDIPPCANCGQPTWYLSISEQYWAHSAWWKRDSYFPFTIILLLKACFFYPWLRDAVARLHTLPGFPSLQNRTTQYSVQGLPVAALLSFSSCYRITFTSKLRSSQVNLFNCELFYATFSDCLLCMCQTRL